MALLTIPALLSCTPSPSEQLEAWCSTEGKGLCLTWDLAEPALRHPSTDAEAPYSAVAGVCGETRYLEHHEDRVPTDQQETTIVVRFFDSVGTLVGVRELHNFDSSGAFSKHLDFGRVPKCDRKPREALSGPHTSVPREQHGVHDQLYILPKFRDGKAVGIRLMKMPDDSWIKDCGLLATDTLTRVNGEPVDPTVVQEQLSRLLKSPTPGPDIKIDAERDGKLVTLLCSAPAL